MDWYTGCNITEENGIKVISTSVDHGHNPKIS